MRVCGHGPFIHVRATPHMQMHVLLGTAAARRRVPTLPVAQGRALGAEAALVE